MEYGKPIFDLHRQLRSELRDAFTGVAEKHWDLVDQRHSRFCAAYAQIGDGLEDEFRVQTIDIAETVLEKIEDGEFGQGAISTLDHLIEKIVSARKRQDTDEEQLHIATLRGFCFILHDTTITID